LPDLGGALERRAVATALDGVEHPQHLGLGGRVVVGLQEPEATGAVFVDQVAQPRGCGRRQAVHS
jgi:hypothetical protein